ncbi:MAG: acetolactate synthase [Opitutales bacterium]
MADPAAPAEVTQHPRFEPVVQFSVHADNKVGRLNEIIGQLAERDVHILALTTLDTTDSTIVRMVVDYPEVADGLLETEGLVFNKTEVVAAEIPSVDYLHRVTCALVQAEINIHYVYPFIFRPHEKSALVLRLEDNDLARETLGRHQIRVLSQHDIAR